MLLLPRRIYQDTRLQFGSTVTSVTTINLTGGSPTIVSRVFSGAAWFLSIRRRRRNVQV